MDGQRRAFSLSCLPSFSTTAGRAVSTGRMQMKTLLAGLFLASTMAAGPAVAQYAPFNEAGVTMGHWHLSSQNVDANKKVFIGMAAVTSRAAQPHRCNSRAPGSI